MAVVMRGPTAHGHGCGTPKQPWVGHVGMKDSSGDAQQHGAPSMAAQVGAPQPSTSKKSSPSLCTILPCRQRLRNHLSFMKSKRKLCLNCCDSCTSRFFSWLQNFCSSLLCKFRLCSSNSRRSRAFWWSSFSYGEIRGL